LALTPRSISQAAWCTCADRARTQAVIQFMNTDRILQVEYVTCPICRADAGTLLLESADLFYPGDERFRLVTCGECGHIYQNPRPTEASIDHYYPPDYHPFQTAIEDEPARLRRAERGYGRWRACMAVHRAAGQPGKILDIGCATGIFLDGMRSMGWQTYGVEPSASAAEYARARFRLDVFQGRLERAHIATCIFDVITLWDVFEHVHEPGQILDEIARILRPGGLLILSLPNPDSLEARLLGRDWVGWDLPRHLNLFRPAQLRLLLARRGFVVERIHSPMYGYATLVMSLEQRLRRVGRYAWAPRLLRSWPLRILAMPYYAGPANWYNLASTMVVVARYAPEGTFE